MDLDQFEAEGAQVVGISVDSVPALETEALSLGGIKYPLLSDYWPHGQVSQEYDSLDPDTGSAIRCTFVIDPEGILRWKGTNPFDEPRDPKEILANLRQVKQGVDPAVVTSRR